MKTEIKNTVAFNDGVAGYNNNRYASNPYRENTDSYSQWDIGFDQARTSEIKHRDEFRSNAAIAKFNKWVDSGAPAGI